MRYRCKECGNEFEDIMPPQHEEPYSPFPFARTIGCPICAQARAMPKKCPSCLSLNVEPCINLITKKK